MLDSPSMYKSWLREQFLVIIYDKAWEGVGQRKKREDRVK